MKPPEGTKVLVTLLPDDKTGYWLQASQASLDAVWDNTRMMCMPSYSKHDIVLVRYPFSDLSSSNVRSAVVKSSPHPSGVADTGYEQLNLQI